MQISPFLLPTQGTVTSGDGTSPAASTHTAPDFADVLLDQLGREAADSEERQEVVASDDAVPQTGEKEVAVGPPDIGDEPFSDVDIKVSSPQARDTTTRNVEAGAQRVDRKTTPDVELGVTGAGDEANKDTERDVPLKISGVESKVELDLSHAVKKTVKVTEFDTSNVAIGTVYSTETDPPSAAGKEIKKVETDPSSARSKVVHDGEADLQRSGERTSPVLNTNLADQVGHKFHKQEADPKTVQRAERVRGEPNDMTARPEHELNLRREKPIGGQSYDAPRIVTPNSNAPIIGQVFKREMPSIAPQTQPSVEFSIVPKPQVDGDTRLAVVEGARETRSMPSDRRTAEERSVRISLPETQTPDAVLPSKKDGVLGSIDRYEGQVRNVPALSTDPTVSHSVKVRFPDKIAPSTSEVTSVTIPEPKKSPLIDPQSAAPTLDRNAPLPSLNRSNDRQDGPITNRAVLPAPSEKPTTWPRQITSTVEGPNQDVSRDQKTLQTRVVEVRQTELSPRQAPVSNDPQVKVSALKDRSAPTSIDWPIKSTRGSVRLQAEIPIATRPHRERFVQGQVIASDSTFAPGPAEEPKTPDLVKSEPVFAATRPSDTSIQPKTTSYIQPEPTSYIQPEPTSYIQPEPTSYATAPTVGHDKTVHAKATKPDVAMAALQGSERSVTDHIGTSPLSSGRPMPNPIVWEPPTDTPMLPLRRIDVSAQVKGDSAPSSDPKVATSERPTPILGSQVFFQHEKTASLTETPFLHRRPDAPIPRSAAPNVYSAMVLQRPVAQSASPSDLGVVSHQSGLVLKRVQSGSTEMLSKSEPIHSDGLDRKKVAPSASSFQTSSNPANLVVAEHKAATVPNDGHFPKSDAALRGEPELAFVPGTSATAGDAPRATQDVRAATVVSQQLASAAKPGTEGRIEVTLRPEELGRVRMMLNLSDSGMHVAILADRPETADLMRRHADVLVQEFRSSGHQDVTFDFGQDKGAAHSEGRSSKAHSVGNPDNVEAADAPIQHGPSPRVDGRVDIRL